MSVQPILAPRISIAVMHHPARSGIVGELVQSCLPFAARVVVDPEPDGIRSPLRTAKVAWAAIRAGATHHLVLQDDAVVCAGFAGHLPAVIAARPSHAIALYSDWNSPQNSYLVRRAAAVGAAWAPLSPADWAPAVGFLLPVEWAHELATYLAPILDEVVDDDEMISRFCGERGIPILAAVPHLVEKRQVPTLTGHYDPYHATVFAGPGPLSLTHWARDPAEDAALATRFHGGDRFEYVVELRGSRCYLRFNRPGTAEPAGHEYGWYWHDWSPLIGVPTGEILAQAPADPLAVEVWAAGYLLGRDVARVPTTRAAAVAGSWLSASIATWIESGLRPTDRQRLSSADVDALVATCHAGVRLGRGAAITAGSSPVARWIG